MKKFFPLLSVIIIFIIVATAQSFFKFIDISAKPSQLSKKINAHYESTFATMKIFNIKGEALDLAKLDSDIVILNFWATWCKPCLAEFPSLVELKKQYPDKKIRVIAINSDEENQKNLVNKIIKNYQLNFDIVLDANGLILEKFMITAIPVSMIFHKGKLIEVSNGAKDFNSIEAINNFKKYSSKNK